MAIENGCGVSDSWAYGEDAALLRVVAAYVQGMFRAWSNETHVADEDVPQLRELIQLRTSQPAPDRSDATISGTSERGASGVRTYVHGAEFQYGLPRSCSKSLSLGNSAGF